MGALILIASGTLAGYVESHKLAVRVEQLEAFLRFISAAQTEIRFSGLPVEQIVQRYGGELEFLRLCGQSCIHGGYFTSAWNTGVAEGTKGRGLLSEDISLIRGFGEGFGASDVDGQLSHCAMYTQLIGERLKNAREEQAKKSKLYLMLGVFSGMVAALMLC
ncbi:MAG: stage III sporulation protein AB [Clostridiales bacterium]|jgi:stage III sporulation protein AB|nr:stage III sporulation protein AB [Clostridiales bacterium]